MVFCSSPSVSRFDVLCILICCSALLSCMKQISELLAILCCPLSLTRCFCLWTCFSLFFLIASCCVCENPKRSVVIEIFKPAYLALSIMLLSKSLQSYSFHILIADVNINQVLPPHDRLMRITSTKSNSAHISFE